MNIDVLKNKLEVIKFSNTSSSEFIINLFNDFINNYNLEKKDYNSDFVKINIENTNIKDIIVIDKYSPNKKIKDNSIIFINLNNYEIGKNWFYEVQNNLYSIYNKLIALSENDLKDEAILNSIIKNDYKDDKFKKYNVNKSKYKLYKLLKKLNKIIIKDNIKNISYLIQYNEDDVLKYNYVLQEVLVSLKIISLKNHKKQVSFIYDYLSDFMDNEFKKYNFCNFKNNQCIAQRDKNNHFNFPFKNYDGCCFDVRNKKKCEFLNVKSCEKCKIKSISCKFLICGYLREKGINYSIYDSLLTKTFFSLNQKLKCIWNFYIDKIDMLKKLT